ncbi:Nif3-like dinuclear metal center hexameric protein [Vagococcus xieshaowenii]|uniref:GTP cyclohydrolase 1 type 2 homolog n=1 Tax=Vagococcus xieshaowenii TaxID=2562451 RepID=A0AAJ5EF11_9ENTE|nr:Nif3-like dinuclear metal center hexameric protein [Vagococcus xieshaowenii]QCA28633.1 Nif3-like dinuclear metal center hexameric protein [Vagococcus xieshaowenii]TFZ40559.1 Nif3-like dinuclear metal center hexameric protein [Vagococcus xieshaowenii]
MLASAFIERFEEYFPLELAEPGDPVGLHIGTLNKEIKRVMITLDVRPEVVAEAIEKKIDLLIAKHPPIFRPVKDLITDHPQQQMFADLLRHDIAVYAAHTNMDIVPNGLNDWFCELLGIEETTYITKTHEINNQSYGIGRVGDIKQAMTLEELVYQVKDTFKLDGLRLISRSPQNIVKRVAICGGSGEKFYRDAQKAGADVYITGDVYYHTGHDMIADDFSVIDAGHYIESLCKEKIVSLCNEWKKAYNWDIEIVESMENTNPFSYY